MNYRYNGEYENTSKRQYIQEAIEFILSKERGSTINNYELAKILNYNIDDEEELVKFKSTMGRIKNFLIDYGYIIKSISGVGYYILKSKQIAGHCYHTYIRKSEKLLNKSERVLNHIDTSELSSVRVKERREVLDLNNDLKTNYENTVNNSSYIKNKSDYDLLED
jgi:hypothetical protein